MKNSSIGNMALMKLQNTRIKIAQ